MTLVVIKKVSCFMLALCLLVAASCSSKTQPKQSTKLLVQQKVFDKPETGEGLAKPIIGHPLLVNHPLNMSVGMSMEGGMGVALAVGMHVGNTKKTQEALSGLSPLNLQQKVIDQLNHPKFRHKRSSFLNRVLPDDGEVVIKPYGYLFGYPKATLELRFDVEIYSSQQETVDQKLLKAKAPEPTIFKLDSWRSIHEQQLKREMDRLITELVERLFQLGIVGKEKND